MDKNSFLKYFLKYYPSQKLIDLLNFTNTISKSDWFSDGFELTIDTGKDGLKTYSNNLTFLKSFFVFANADNTGSVYAFWKISDNLEDNPIVAFGDEGGFHIIAKNLDEFFQILAYDAEPMIDWENISYYKNESTYEQSKYINEYKKWLTDKYKISVNVDADIIVEKAKKVYQNKFNQWISEYYQK